MKFIFTVLWLWFVWWSLPALIISLPALAIGALILSVWPGRPRAPTWASYKADCLAGRWGERAKSAAEDGHFEKYIEYETRTGKRWGE